MTLERIILDPTFMLIAFGSRDRSHMQCLAERANYLLHLIYSKTATKLENNEYHALKFIIKEMCDSTEYQRVKK